MNFQLSQEIPHKSEDNDHYEDIKFKLPNAFAEIKKISDRNKIYTKSYLTMIWSQKIARLSIYSESFYEELACYYSYMTISLRTRVTGVLKVEIESRDLSIFHKSDLELIYE